MVANNRWRLGEIMGLTDMEEDPLTADALTKRAEESLLRSALVSADQAALLPTVACASDFASPAHALIFAAIGDVLASECPVSEETVIEALRSRGRLDLAGGVMALTYLTRLHVTHAHFTVHARMVREAAAIRRAATAARRVIALAESGARIGTIDEASRDIVTATAADDAVDFIPFAEVIQRTLEHLDSPAASGLSTGLRALDRQIGGLRAGQLIVVGARPAMGKSALAQTIAANVAAIELANSNLAQQFPRAVVFASLEMAPTDLGVRALSRPSGVYLSRLAHGRMAHGDQGRIYRVSGGVGALPIQVVNGKPPVAQLRARCHRLAARTGIAAVVVDYLQLFPSERAGDNREREVAEWSRSLKLLAGELGCPVVALSQLNRGVESRADKRPMLSDLRESGAVEQDADVVMFVYRDEVYNKESAAKGTAELIVAKQRQGPIGTAVVAFDAAFAWFHDLPGEPVNEPPPDEGGGYFDGNDPGEGLPDDHADLTLLSRGGA